MNDHKKIIVITSINEKSEGIGQFEMLEGWHVLVVADKKSKPMANTDNLTFLSCEEQLELGYEYAGLCPWNHYARKNIGYLHAVRLGARIIYDTDDDNLPYDQYWHEPEFRCSNRCEGTSNFVNIYSHFCDDLVWPRGLPLDEIHGRNVVREDSGMSAEIGVWQGLADIDPDVDAIFRLLFEKEIRFQRHKPVYLPEGTYCPFNSQNTFWHQSLFPLLYLPATVSIRGTDIYRGYIAQRIMWQVGRCLGFMEATVYQERNAHDLMRDFRDEVTSYCHIKELVEILNNAVLTGDIRAGIETVYGSLQEKHFVEAGEIDLLRAWQADLDAVAREALKSGKSENTDDK